MGPATRVQPVAIEDLTEALYRLLERDAPRPALVQAAGPRVWRMIELLAKLRERAGLHCRLLPLPDWTAVAMAAVAELMPGAPICRDQVRLMRTDKVADPALPDLASLGIRTSTASGHSFNR